MNDTASVLYGLIYVAARKHPVIQHIAKNHARGVEWFADYVTHVIMNQIDNQLDQPMNVYEIQHTPHYQDKLTIDNTTHYYQFAQYTDINDNAYQIGYFDAFQLKQPPTLYITTCEQLPK